jgi:hypothetical protein
MSDGMDTARIGLASNGIVNASGTSPANGIVAGGKTIK